MASSKITTKDLSEPVVDALNTIDTVADQITVVDGNVSSIKSTVESNSNKLDNVALESTCQDILTSISTSSSGNYRYETIASNNVKSILINSEKTTTQTSANAALTLSTFTIRNFKGTIKLKIKCANSSGAYTHVSYSLGSTNYMFTSASNTSYKEYEVTISVKDDDIISVEMYVSAGTAKCNYLAIAYDLVEIPLTPHIDIA